MTDNECSSIGGGRTVFVNRFFHPDHSATSQVLSDLAFALGREGSRVTVLTSRQLYDHPRSMLEPKERIRNVDVERLGSTSFGRSSAAGRLLDYVSFVWAARRRLKHLVREGTVVVAKTDPPMLGVFLRRTVHGRGGRMINWLQDVFPEVLGKLVGSAALEALSAPLRAARDVSLRRAEMNVVIGEEMKEYLVGCGVPASRLRVVENWAYDEIPGAQQPIPEDWRPTGSFIVGYFGNLGRAHEYETVLGAMRELRDRPDIVFLFVGGGALLVKLEAAVHREGLPNFQRREYVSRSMLRVALRVPDVHLVILRPDLEGLVVPSKFAGVAEAGRPVIYVGSAEGDIGGMVRESGCGYVVPTGASAELAARIQELAGDPEAVSAMGARAREVYEARYRSETAFEKWRAVLEEVGGRMVDRRSD